MPPRGKSKYSEDTIQEALSSIRNGMSYKRASILYKDPRATLQFRLSGNFRKIRFGPRTLLTEEEELEIVDWIIQNKSRGFQRSRRDIQLGVQEYLKNNNKPNPFLDGVPGSTWYKIFIKRHPILLKENTKTSQKPFSIKDRIARWFRSIQQLLSDRGLFKGDDLDPSRIFNLDETCFNLICSEDTLIVDTKRNCDDSNGNITVLLAFSAIAHVSPPMVIYPSQSAPPNIANSVPDSWGIWTSESGLKNTDILCEYLENGFCPFLKSNNIKRPVVLFVDSRLTNPAFKLCRLCDNLGIILIGLYPSAIRLLSYTSKCIFRPIRYGCQKIFQNWSKNFPDSSVNVDGFHCFLEQVINDINAENEIPRGFAAMGLHPWNMDVANFCEYELITEQISDTTTCHKNEQGNNEVKLINNNQILNFQLNVSKRVLNNDLVLGETEQDEKQSLHIDNNQTNKCDMKSIDYNTFVEIAGDSLIEQFEGLSQLSDVCLTGNLAKLYKMWTVLTGVPCNNIEHTAVEKESLLSDINDVVKRVETCPTKKRKYTKTLL